MIKEIEFVIDDIKQLTENICELTLSGEGGFTSPGQFMNITVEGFFLRRPISVCDFWQGGAKIIFRSKGSGTTVLKSLQKGASIKALSPLGNGFDTKSAPQKIAVIGGGIGVPPVYGLTKELINLGKKVIVGLGFTKLGEVFYVDEFRALGAEVVVTTDDGSLGESGLITDVMKKYSNEYSYSFACGPLPMLKSVYLIEGFSSGQYSLEERMGCGFGACMCCSVNTKNDPKRVCSEGPVFSKEELLWN